jgi:nitrite reductase/ring-hydroxylating ferredoxin subunit
MVERNIGEFLSSAKFLGVAPILDCGGIVVSEAGFVSSMKDAELQEGQMKGIRLKGRAILLVKRGGQVFALSNTCLHMGCSLDKGILRDFLVMCPCHGWKYDVRNGHYQENSAISLVSYPCKVQNGRVYVKLESKI